MKKQIQQNPRQLLNPRIDGIFKTIFTQNTKESRLALRSFLEAILERKIVDLKLTANTGIKQFLEQRGVDYDISVVFDDGEQAEIEMQAYIQHYDYKLRAEYLVTRLLNSLMKKGFKWERIRKVHQISILGFENTPECREAFHHYVLRSEDGHTLSKILNVYFLELPKLPELTEDMIPQLNTREKWGILLRDADDPKKLDLVKQVAETEVGIMAAFDILNGMTLTQRLWLWQTKRMIKEADRISDREGAIAEGHAKGIAEGRAKGRAEGLTEGESKAKLESAKNLISLGLLTSEQIAAAVGLPVEQVEKLSKEIVVNV